MIIIIKFKTKMYNLINMCMWIPNTYEYYKMCSQKLIYSENKILLKFF